MIREELLHPLFSHFPIVLFVLALLTKIIWVILRLLKNQHAPQFQYISKLIIYVAPFTYLISIYLGDFALDQIKSDFCDLHEVYKHEEVAYYALYCFLVVLALEAVSELKSKLKMILQAGTILFLILGNFYLFETAHLGAKLVYDMGAAVKVAPKCN